MTKDGRVDKITNLTRNVSAAQKDMECYQILIKLLTLQLNQAAIPYFKRDKVGVYNMMINSYST
jgi:hypothetical protein